MKVVESVSGRQIYFIIQEFKNISSNLNLVDEMKTLEITQCEVSSITFHIQKSSGVIGHLISIKGVFRIGGETDTEFSAIGKISEIKFISDQQQQVKIKMNQYDVETWKRIVEKLQKEQKRIDTLFSAMKGED